jgi:hypothetical protein
MRTVRVALSAERSFNILLRQGSEKCGDSVAEEKDAYSSVAFAPTSPNIRTMACARAGGRSGITL